MCVCVHAIASQYTISVHTYAFVIQFRFIIPPYDTIIFCKLASDAIHNKDIFCIDFAINSNS